MIIQLTHGDKVAGFEICDDFDLVIEHIKERFTVMKVLYEV